MRKFMYPIIWLAVTATAVLIASAAVSSVRDQVTDTPTAMLPPTTMAISSTDQLVASVGEPETTVPATADESSETTTTAPATTTTAAPTTTTTAAPTTTSSSPDRDSPDATTTTTVAPTTTTTSAPPTGIRSFDLVGGSVSVEIGDGTVRLAGASPKPGFTMEVENSGPEKVEVEFHNDDHESHFTGKFEDGHFVRSIGESSGEDDD